MTKEQEKAIYRLNLGKNIPISNDCCIVNIQDIETALSIIETPERNINPTEKKAIINKGASLSLKNTEHANAKKLVAII